ncbi:hypothetical protein BDR04DRAFT_348187 [Suillus decipiens]|nr:hypothetical protein BDR04DRAFT_348187 [Suillus decipiens]
MASCAVWAHQREGLPYITPGTHIFLFELFSLNIAIASGICTVFLVMYDDFELSHHPIFKNLCNAGGYATIELGSLLVL